MRAFSSVIVLVLGCAGAAGGGGKFALAAESSATEPTSDPVSFAPDVCDSLPEVKQAACREASGAREPEVAEVAPAEVAPEVSSTEAPEAVAVESSPEPPPPPRCAWVLFDEEGFAIAEGEGRVAIVEGRVSFVDLPKPTAYAPELFLCRIDGAVVSLDGLTIGSEREVRYRPPPRPREAPRAAASSCPGGVTTTGRCCRSGCACGGSCISCSRRCRH